MRAEGAEGSRRRLRMMSTGKISTRLVLLLAVVLVFGVLAWWFLQPRSSTRLRSLERTPETPNASKTPGDQAQVGQSDRFPGRRRLDGPVAPLGLALVELGSEQTITQDHSVGVSRYEATLQASVEGSQGDLVVDTARVEACAGSSGWSGGALAAAYHLAYPRVSGGFDLRPAASGLSVRDPSLSTRLAGDLLAAGECREGWVTFVLGTPDEFDDRLPTAIVFDNTAFGFVEERGRGRAAWRIEE